MKNIIAIFSVVPVVCPILATDAIADQWKKDPYQFGDGSITSIRAIVPNSIGNKNDKAYFIHGDAAVKCGTENGHVRGSQYIYYANSDGTISAQKCTRANGNSGAYVFEKAPLGWCNTNDHSAGCSKKKVQVPGASDRYLCYGGTMGVTSTQISESNIIAATGLGCVVLKEAEKKTTQTSATEPASSATINNVYTGGSCSGAACFNNIAGHTLTCGGKIGNVPTNNYVHYYNNDGSVYSNRCVWENGAYKFVDHRITWCTNANDKNYNCTGTTLQITPATFVCVNTGVARQLDNISGNHLAVSQNPGCKFLAPNAIESVTVDSKQTTPKPETKKTDTNTGDKNITQKPNETNNEDNNNSDNNGNNVDGDESGTNVNGGGITNLDNGEQESDRQDLPNNAPDNHDDTPNNAENGDNNTEQESGSQDPQNTTPGNQNNTTPNADDNDDTAEQARIDAEQAQQDRLNDLRKNADDMKAKEQSLANRLVGAASIGMTGIGAMQAASALAEKNADDMAERDMAAYLETFRCDFGQGKNIRGGDRDIELPGGNDLFDLYLEYNVLADSVKNRKDALGLRPGIEAEVVISKADTGLYDNESLGKTTGSYTSVARALMDPNGEDAKAWEKQKSDAAKKLKTGALVAAGGVAVGVLGNVLANIGQPKERSAEINRNYASLIKAVDETGRKANDLKPVHTCAEDNATGDYESGCTCNDPDARWFRDGGGCVKCDNGMKYDEHNACTVCPDDKPVKQGNQCVAQKSECELTGILATDAECQCGENTTRDGNHCKCATGFGEKTDNPGKCTADAPAVEVLTELFKPDGDKITGFDIPADRTFASGSAKIDNPGAQSLIEELASKLTAAAAESTENETAIRNKDYCIEIVGHTDRTGGFRLYNAETGNQGLSESRANAVKKVLTDRGYDAALIRTSGKGWNECTNPPHTLDNDESCRRVNISLKSGACKG